MKTRLTQFAAYALLGCASLLIQSVIEPVAANGITRCLKDSAERQWPHLAGLLLLFAVCSIFMPVCESLSNIAKETLVARRVKSKTAQMMRKILFTENRYFLKNDPESIVNTMSHDVETGARFIVALILDVPLIAAGLAISLVTMYLGSWPGLSRFGFISAQKGDAFLATLVLFMLPLRLAFLLFDKKFRECERIRYNASNDVICRAVESIRGITDVRSANAFSFMLDRIGLACARFYKARTRTFSLITVLSCMGGVAGGMAETALLSAAALLICRKLFPGSGLKYEDYTGFVVLANAFNMYAGRAVQCVASWREARPSLLRTAELECLPDAFGPSVGEPLRRGPHALSFENVCLTLPNGAMLLSDVSLTINPGEHVALVGPSGCGKTTLLKTAARHLSPTSGSVRFGAQPVEALNFCSYARKVAYVSQRPFIFKGTIRDNILAGRSGLISDERLLEIADDVGLIQDLKNKDPDVNKALDFELHAEGRDLSGGQMAKIALARALAGDPDVFLLDEVTAPLDERSQRGVLDLFAGKYRGKTVVSISHRLPAMQNADRIVVMDAGRVVQTGTFDGLSNESGVFAGILARETRSTARTRTVCSVGFENSVRGIIQTLSMCPVFSGLSAASLAELAPRVGHVSAVDGAWLFRKGDPGDSLLIIRSGTVEIGGKRYGPGACFGEIAVFYGGIRSADVLAVGDCDAICVGRNALLDYIAKNPDVAIPLLEETARIAVRESGAA